MKRHTHWATRHFHQFLIERATMPFEWGVNDCALFAADGVKAMTGTDIADDFRGKYNNETGAFGLIRSITGGGTSVADAATYCAKKHGLTEWPKPLFAQRGDLVVFQAPTGDLVAGLVHLNGRHIVSVGEQGLYRFPISQVKRAWHV